MKIAIILAMCLHTDISATAIAATGNTAPQKIAPSSTPPSPVTVAPQEALPQPAGDHEFNQGMLPVVHGYIVIQHSLAHDHIKGVHQAARSMLTHLKALSEVPLTGKNAESYSAIASELPTTLQPFLAVKTVKEARDAFYDLSYTITLWATTAKPPGFALAFCPMAQGGNGGGWLQKEGPLRNPYFGSAMLQCGRFIKLP